MYISKSGPRVGGEVVIARVRYLSSVSLQQANLIRRRPVTKTLSHSSKKLFIILSSTKQSLP